MTGNVYISPALKHKSEKYITKTNEQLLSMRSLPKLSLSRHVNDS